MIELNETSISISEDGTAFANLFLYVNENNYYPQNQWNDFVAIVLSWWSQEIINYLSKNIDIGIFSFMDGDYEYRITRQNNTHRLTCYENPHGSSTIVFNEQINILNFVLSLQRSINLLLRFAKDKNVKLEGLPEYLKDLQPIISNLR